jgi:hypothetical protein
MLAKSGDRRCMSLRMQASKSFSLTLAGVMP